MPCSCWCGHCFDAICALPNLHTLLAASQPTLKSLRSRRIISATQWGKLFPAIPATVSSKHFDITLLMALLRNICGLTPPLTGWDVLPAATDLSREADIARVKYFRNTVYAHAEHASYWWCNIWHKLQGNPRHSSTDRRGYIQGKLDSKCSIWYPSIFTL